jgi:hypothetical protein
MPHKLGGEIRSGEKFSSERDRQSVIIQPAKSAGAISGNLDDTLSYLWSWRWPVAQGDVTAVDAGRIQRGRDTTYRLAIAYEFSLGADGPYTGESFWRPAFLARRRVQSKAREFHRRQPVTVRYRPDDPSVNRFGSHGMAQIAFVAEGPAEVRRQNE